jgi:hypothetical protein
VPLSPAIKDREYDKFVDVSGNTAVRVSGENFSGSFSVSGLKVAGKVTEVTINDTTWTALPAAALANRNALAIQNYSGQLVKINYSNSVSGFVGAHLPDGQERFYDITDAIVQYAKCESGTATIVVEELS